jgi:3-phenylpropionate/cinnamic acid dioxygenase small subunit
MTVGSAEGGRLPRLPERGPHVERYQAVTDVLVRYASGIDGRDWPLLRSCFTDDCEADYGDIGHWHGGDEITTWMAQTHHPLGPTLHRISNVVVRHEDGRIRSRCAVHAVIVMADRSAAVHAYGLYDDVFVGADDDPRIARRRFTQVTTELHRALG